LGIAQVLFAACLLLFTGLHALIFQGLVVLGMLLVALRIPRRIFADPPASP
jgi:hypothetical protein